MVSPKILEKFGCTNERLRTIFTRPGEKETPAQVSLDHVNPPEQPKTDSEIRTRFESRIRSRLIDGIGIGLKTARPYQAVDIAADAKPIAPETIPLMLWACGKLKIETLQGMHKQFTGGGMSEAQADTFFKKDDKQRIVGLNEVRIAEFHVDLMKSYIRRRLAAMNVLWSNLWPLFKYEPRGTDDLSLFRGDVLSQRVDIMSDAYNYRHLRGQANRQMLLYGFSVAFPRQAWDVKRSWRAKKDDFGKSSDEPESYVEREGVDFVLPHPSRMFWDQSSPLANINTDTGPKWIGYWDIARYGDLIAPESPYFNINNIFVSDGWIELANMAGDYFAYYFNPTVIAWPEANQDISLYNDRSMKVGRYTSEAPDQGVLLTNYYELINPKQEGIGGYDSDVWIRLTVAGDCTIVGAEFMPSRPAAYGAIDCNDNRFANQSMGMALLSYQDQATNIVTQMIQQLRASLIMLILLDSDSLPADIIEMIKKNGANQDWWVDPKIWTYSASKLKEQGFQDPKAAFLIIQAQVSNVIQTGLAMLGQLLNLADRLLILSPNELGQPNPREVSAREVSEVSTSVQSMYSFINEGPREQTTAMKQIIYESLMCCGTQAIRVPVEKRYTKAIVEAAGFKVTKVQGAGTTSDDVLPVKAPVEGTLRDLQYDYYFDSREGTERVQNNDGANAIVNLLQFLLKLPGVPQKLGLNTILDASNLVIRLTGAPWNFQFEVPRGQDDALPPEQSGGDDQMKQMLAVMAGQLQTVEKILVQGMHIDPKIFQQPQGGPPGQPGQPPPNGAAPAGGPPASPLGPPAAPQPPAAGARPPSARPPTPPRRAAQAKVLPPGATLRQPAQP